MLARREAGHALYRLGGMAVDNGVHGPQHAHVADLAVLADHETRVDPHGARQAHGRPAHVAEILLQGIASAFHLGMLLHITIYRVAIHHVLLRHHLRAQRLCLFGKQPFALPGERIGVSAERHGGRIGLARVWSVGLYQEAQLASRHPHAVNLIRGHGVEEVVVERLEEQVVEILRLIAVHYAGPGEVAGLTQLPVGEVADHYTVEGLGLERRPLARLDLQTDVVEIGRAHA